MEQRRIIKRPASSPKKLRPSDPGPSGTEQQKFGNGDRTYGKSIHPLWLTMEQACTPYGRVAGTFRDSVNGRHDGVVIGVEGADGKWYIHRDEYIKMLCRAWGYKAPEKMGT